ncbi:hypothetical protein MKP08_08240 [Erythrobacter sp. LQ02-29]|uniref:hypothetical protein n=1 Tax=Erythrobacter sp. LQ02-29 TaxID=2920384 RepID=UPI001F4EBB94|nr:hypothetical protein [Erythrobacter sp. LQ02-29]MCP9222732.1 hypothetical protein [Erythrobacter sp. LQ02-29]
MEAKLSAFIARNAIILAIFAVVLGVAVVQTVRIDGLALRPFGFKVFAIEGLTETVVKRDEELAAIKSAQNLAAQLARNARLERERIYSDLAERIDHDATADLDTALGATERFIAAGGMRGQAARCPGGATRTGPADQGSRGSEGARRAPQLDAPGAGDGNSAGEDSEGLVLVSAEDVRLCTLNTIKAEAGHRLAIDLEKASATHVEGPVQAPGSR